MKLTDLIKRHGLEMRLNKVTRNPYFDSLMHAHFEVTLFRVEKGLERKFTTYQSYSLKKKGEPSIEEVLKALIQDCSSIEVEPEFENWIDESGRDLDPEKAFGVFEVIKSNAEHFKKFLGPVVYFQFLASL